MKLSVLEAKILDFLASLPAEQVTRYRRILGRGLLEEGQREVGAHVMRHPLDPLPIVLERTQWQDIQAAVVQRLTVWNAFLKDIYGSAEVLERGVVRWEPIYEDPNFLRECVNLPQTGHLYLFHLAVDLVRDCEGQWRVLRDCVGIPTEAALAVESRKWSWELLRPLLQGERSLVPHRDPIVVLVECLEWATPVGRSGPRAVLLGEGPESPAYTQQALLARHMGIPMVRGDDLLVLDRALFFKTVGGLEEVNIVYRGIPSALADPVSVEPSSCCGVPGLLSALRAGALTVVNPLGSELVENHLVAGAFSSLCRWYFQEEPKLPSVSVEDLSCTGARDSVEDPDSPVLVTDAWGVPQGVPALSPVRKVVWENLSLEKRPVWNDGEVVFRPYALRVFGVYRNGIPQVLPCAIAWVPMEGVGIASLFGKGKGSWLKDVWVQDFEAAEETRPVRRFVRKLLRRTRMGSRQAENLFWMGRYLQRAETAIRMYRFLDELEFEVPTVGAGSWRFVWEAVASTLGYGSRVFPPDRAPHSEALAHSVLWNADNPSSACSCIEAAKRNAYASREALSPEVWGALEALYDVATRGEGVFKGERSSDPDCDRWVCQLLEALDRFWGVFDKHMLYNDGWFFFRMGWYLESSLCTALVLWQLRSAPATVGLVSLAEEDVLWDALLRMMAAQYAHRSSFPGRASRSTVLKLLLYDPQFPRSVAFGLKQMELCLDSLVGSQEVALRYVRHLRSSLDIAEWKGRDRRHDPGLQGEDRSASFEEESWLAEWIDRLLALYPILHDYCFGHQASLDVESDKQQ